jgi:hypothetical protein
MDETGEHYVKQINQTQKDMYHIFSLTCGILKIKFTEVDCRIWLPEARKWGENGRCWLKGTVSVTKEEYILW